MFLFCQRVTKDNIPVPSPTSDNETTAGVKGACCFGMSSSCAPATDALTTALSLAAENSEDAAVAVGDV